MCGGAEVRSENTESKRTNQKGKIVTVFEIVAIQDDVGFTSLILSIQASSSSHSVLPLLFMY